jgi:cytoskeleton protein RodZ
MGVSVRHNARLAALVALAAAVMTVAWFSRALQTESATDWLWCLVVAVVALVQLLVIRDGRAPLMVADEHGVRVRRGETWSGLRWQDIEHVEVRSPASWLRDGQIVVHPRDLSGDLPTGEESGDSMPTETGEAYVVPLARTTKVEYDGLTGDLVDDLDALASGRVPVLVLTRVEQERPEQAPEVSDAEETETVPLPQQVPTGSTQAAPQAVPLAEQPALVVELPTTAAETSAAEAEAEAEVAEESGAPTAGEHPDAPERDRTRLRARSRWGQMAARLARLGAKRPADEASDEQADAQTDAAAAAEDRLEEEAPEFDPVDPARETLPAARSEVSRDSVRMLPNPPAIPAQRTAQSAAHSTGESPVVVARVHDYVAGDPNPAPDALIGPLIAAARNRARLSIDTLSERTRIRPHVLECIEVDDFEVCGGDFYSRGHLRTLARIFGLDAQQLLDLYDDHYAKAEIEARQVFEAELASGIGGGVRAAHTGPRWTLLAACVLALASIWGVARVFNDTPQELVSPAPNVVDSAGLAKADPAPKMTLATLEVSAEGASPQVVVRDRDGLILWAGKLAQGQHQQVIGMAPFDVTASNGGAVKVSFLGKPNGAVGDSQAAGSKQFG